MNSYTVDVRTALMPVCYMDFHCLAAACRDNCCGGWEIIFNKKDYLRLKRAAESGELKEILTQGMSRFREDRTEERYAHFSAATEGRCTFQTEEGLCRLQLECGEKAMPWVCRKYPRHEIYTVAGKELSLTLSCEGVLALLWDLPQGIDFWEEPLPKQEWRLVTQSSRYARFVDIRSFCIDVLQERTLPFFRRMQLLGVLIQRLKGMDWSRDEVVDDWLAQGEGLLHDASVNSLLGSLPQNRFGFLKTNIRILFERYQQEKGKVDVYRDLFSAVITEADWEEKGLDTFTVDPARYQELEERLEGLLGGSDYFFENLMVMAAFYIKFPDVQGAEELWRSYACLCGLYSFYRFAAVCGCARETSRQRLFHVLGRVSRSLLHNQGNLKQLVDMLLEGNSGTLANMAILVRG